MEALPGHQGTANTDLEIPLWIAEGKTSLLQKPEEFSSQNQKPISSLNTIYKWFTSCRLKPIDQHLNAYGLMQGEQRRERENCSGTINNPLIDRMVSQDSHRGKRNLHVSVAWVDVRKAYDLVDHRWIN